MQDSVPWAPLKALRKKFSHGGQEYVDCIEEGCDRSFCLPDPFLSGMHISAQGRSFMPFHSHMFPVCPRGLPQARTFQGALPVGTPYPPLPSLGRSWLRSGTMTDTDFKRTKNLCFCSFEAIFIRQQHKIGRFCAFETSDAVLKLD